MNHLLKAINRTPPFLVYYLAHDSKASLSHPGPKVLADRSGLSQSTVMRLSRKLTWCRVDVCTIDAFCDACGCSLVTEEVTKTPHGRKTYQHTRYNVRTPHAAYLRDIALGAYQNQLRYLTPAQRKRFDSMCEKWSNGAKDC